MKIHHLITNFCIFTLLHSTALAERQQLRPLKADTPPILDGTLADACWGQVKQIELTPRGEADSGIPSTSIKCVYTKDAVYFAFDCREPKVNLLKKGEPGRNKTWQMDSVEMFIDTDSDMQSYLQIGFAPGGAWMASYCPTPGNAQVISGNLLEFKPTENAKGYIIEAKLPFAKFPVSKEPLSPTWNIFFGRYRYVDMEKSQIATWQGYLMDGKHHKPKTWGDLGPFEINFSKLGQDSEANAKGPCGWEYLCDIPKPYVVTLSDRLDPSLGWIKQERLRIAWSWLTNVKRYIDNAQHQHDFRDVLDLVVKSGFNVVIPNAAVKTKTRRPYQFMAVIEAMIETRMAGARPMLSTGYTWRSGSDPAMKCRRFVSKNGDTDEKMICPLEPFPWRDNLAHPVLDALAEAEKLGVPDLFFGVWFDMEPQASMGSHVGVSHGYCYCDHCWQTFCDSHPEAEKTMSLKNRSKSLLLDRMLETYHKWQEEAVTTLVRKELEPVRQKAPHLIFGYYPFHQQKSWMTCSVAKGVSTPQAPAILMDDNTYWGGYTEKPSHVARTRKAVTEMLGYEPLYTPSIGYCSPERNGDGTPKYPVYSPERAGREAYLLTKTSAAFLAWGGTRDHRKDLLEDQRIFYTDGFTKAFEQLAKEGVIENVPVQPATGDEKQKLEAALSEVRSEIVKAWGKVHGKALAHVDVPVSGAFTGESLTIIKTLPNSKIYNMTGADYQFTLDLKQPPDSASLEIFGFPRRGCADRTRILVKVDGKKVAYLNHPFDKNRKSVTLDIPANLIKPETIITIAYFLDDSYEETRYDNSLTIRSMKLTIE